MRAFVEASSRVTTKPDTRENVARKAYPCSMVVDDNLALADRHIAEGERRLQRLGEILDAAKARGADTSTLVATIQAIEETLATFQAHRDALARRRSLSRDERRTGHERRGWPMR
jgi:hypothetical protein